MLAGLGGDKGKGGKQGRDLCTVCRWGGRTSRWRRRLAGAATLPLPPCLPPCPCLPSHLPPLPLLTPLYLPPQPLLWCAIRECTGNQTCYSHLLVHKWGQLQNDYYLIFNHDWKNIWDLLFLTMLMSASYGKWDMCPALSLQIGDWPYLEDQQALGHRGSCSRPSKYVDMKPEAWNSDIATASCCQRIILWLYCIL